jgi:hypothetical protein
MVIIVLSIPLAMLAASFFLDQETMEWKNPFRKDEK